MSLTTSRILALIICILGALLGWYIASPSFNLHYGLDLRGGAQLVYKADTTAIDPSQIDDAMSALRDVIERRINAFGVSEPNVQVEQGGLGSGGEHRLIVELPGVTDINQAIEEIGKTPLLEFKLLSRETPNVTINAETGTSTQIGDFFEDTGLTGRLLRRASLVFNNQPGSFSNTPIIQIEFNEEGSALFERITTEHVGESLFIFLDGEVISDPRINEPIAGGTAIISGQFTPTEARDLVKNLNLGALPVPIELISTQTIGATLGDVAKDAGLKAGIIGFALVALFLILWYRLPGVIATISLIIYILLMILLFKLFGIVLTAAGIAGFILSMGMAVDANVLIFERMKEELSRHDGNMQESIKAGFSRAWPSIRDGNLSSIISALVLYWAGTTLTKGFAITWGIGIVLSMFTSITISRTFLLALGTKRYQGTIRFLYGVGFKNRD